MNGAGSKLGWAQVLLIPVAVLVAACGGGGADNEAGAATAVSAADLEKGRKLYQQNCAMCHGFNGEGVRGLGKSIVGSQFVRDRSDAELVRFLIEGRPVNHPDNTQGIAMPPRGGNPALSDADLEWIVAYMRSMS